MHSCQEKEERHAHKAMARIGPSDFLRDLKGKKMHTPTKFSPTIATVISMNWGNLFSSQVRDCHRKQRHPSPGFDIQSRLMGLNTQVEPTFFSPSIPWEEWTTEHPGCYGHQHFDLTVSQPVTSVQMQHLQPLPPWRTLPQAWRTSYTWSKQWCLVTA